MDETEQKHLAEVKGLGEELAEKNEQQAASAEKTKKLLDEAESFVESANMNFDALQSKTKTWHNKLATINFFLENFPEANMFAIRAMKKMRAEAGAPVDDEVSMEELLEAVSERVRTLKSCGVDFLKLAIHAFRMLWLDEDPPELIEPLPERLLLTEDWLDQWRESDGRATADKALSFVLSWYKDINLDVLARIRGDDKWLNDPELIKKRQERAYAMIEYTMVHAWCEGPSFLDLGDPLVEVADEEGGDSEETESDDPDDPTTDVPHSADAPSTTPGSESAPPNSSAP